MASDSQTAIATTTEKPLENKVNEEAKLMEKEIVADVVKDKPISDSNLTVTKEEEIDQTPAGELEKESPAVVEEVEAVVKPEEPTEIEKDGSGEKVAEQVEPIIVKEGVEEVTVGAVDEEKPEEKQTVESVVEEENKIKEETKVVDVSESTTDEAGGKQVEPVAVQSVRDVSAETPETQITNVEVLEVEPRKPEAPEKVEMQPEKAEELAPDVEVVKTEGTPETTEQAKVEVEGQLEDKIVDTKDSGINSQDENTSESGSALCPEEIVPTNQKSDTDPKKETEGVASSSADVSEKAITEETHVVDESSKDEKTSESASALCPEEVVPKNQESDIDPKKETEADASSPDDVIEKAITEEKHVLDEPPKIEETSETGSALSPVEVVPTNQDSNTNSKKETEGDASSPADVIEKAITEEKHVVEEPSKDDNENVSENKHGEAKLTTKDENTKKDTEPAVDGKSDETLKEADTESGEKETVADKQDESITEKVAEVVETAPVSRESDEPKQQPEVTAKEVALKQKNSNSIISKMKQSLVKAKKAIIGKSPSSKTTSTEEVKVK